MKIKKSHIYNILFVILLGLIVYPNSRTWFIRQLAFSPSVKNEVKREVLTDYSWKLKGLTVDNLDFSSTKGKVVFVNFWATWCPPCRAEMPMIQKLYDDYKGKIEFVMVTTDTKNKVESYYKKNNYNLPTYGMISKEPQQMTTTSIPASYLIDKKGKIVISKVGAANWNSDKVRKLIDELLSQ